jgi:DNA helicase IV
MSVGTPWADVWLSAAEWAEAFDSADVGTSHNDARDQVWEALLDILIDQFDDEEVPSAQVRRSLVRNEDLASVFARAWPLLDPVGIVADLWSRPAYLRACAPDLSAEQVELLQRPDPRAWTVSDLPYLDAARQRVGDPDAVRRRHQRDAAIASDREEMSRVIEHLIETDDSEMHLMSVLRGDDFRNALEDEAALPSVDPDLLAGPFAHIVVDEAQELTDAEWQMLLRRCPSRSFTIVGDRAQARRGFAESWQDRLGRIGLDPVTVSTLTINYRTPEEVMAAAEPIIRAALPDANVPTSIRRSGVPVTHGAVSELGVVLGEWLAGHAEGIACVIGDPTFVATSRVRSLTPVLAKGLEFDLVVLVDPERFGVGIEGAVDRYVAMTRATGQLVILVSDDGTR